MRPILIDFHKLHCLKPLYLADSLRQYTKAIKFGVMTSFIVLSFGAMSAQAAESSQLNALITQAIGTHPSIGAAKAEQQATIEGITAAKLNLLPKPSFSAGYNSENDLVSSLNIRQNLWTGGRLTASVNQAIFDDKAATEHIFEAQNEVAKTTIDAWQSYITAVTLQQVYLNSLKRLDGFEQMMTRRVNQGVSARIELDLVTNRILQEQNAYQGALEQQRIAVARLEQIIGHKFEQGVVPDLADLVQQAKLQASGFEKVIFDELSFSNPTVVKQRYQVEAAKQEVKTKEAARYPTVYAQYQHTYYLKDKKNDNKVSLGLDYQPGAGFSDKALTRASVARVQGLEQSEEAVRRKALENIQVQYQQFVSARDQELSLVAAVSGAQIVLNSYKRQFIAGRKSWLDVLNAAREQSQYDVQLVNIRANLLGAFYKLQVDFGMMDWQEFQKNRQPIQMFHPFDPVKAWLNKHDLVKTKDTTLVVDSDDITSNDGYISEGVSETDNATVNQEYTQGYMDNTSYEYMPYDGISYGQTLSLSEVPKNTTPIQESQVVDEEHEESKDTQEIDEKNVMKDKLEYSKKWLKGLFNSGKKESQPSQNLQSDDLQETIQNKVIESNIEPKSIIPQNPKLAEFSNQGFEQQQFNTQESLLKQNMVLHKTVEPKQEPNSSLDSGQSIQQNYKQDTGQPTKKLSFAKSLLQKVSQKDLSNFKVETANPKQTIMVEPEWVLTTLDKAEKVDLKLDNTNDTN